MGATNDSPHPQTYEARNDLAVRSAAGDPMVEQHGSPSYQRRKTSLTTNSPVLNAGGIRMQPSEPPKTQNSHAKQSSLDKLKDAQIQSSGISGANVSPKRELFSNAATAGDVTIDGLPTTSQKLKAHSKAAAASDVTPTGLPDFIMRRNELFDRLKQKARAEILKKEKPEIDVVLDLGLDAHGVPRPAMPVAAKAWESTPGSFLRHVDKDVSSNVVVAKVDGKQLWDLDRPLEYACRVSYVSFSSAEGRNVFWHSSAHVLGEAAECHYNCLLSHGPPVEQGFFYDMALTKG